MLPALGDAVTFTVTVALAFVHGAMPATVYTYDPGVLSAGSKMPDDKPPGPFHVPPASGIPPRDAIKALGADDAQSVRLPSVPALGCVEMLTAITEEEEHGGTRVPTV